MIYHGQRIVTKDGDFGWVAIHDSVTANILWNEGHDPTPLANRAELTDVISGWFECGYAKNTESYLAEDTFE